MSGSRACSHQFVVLRGKLLATVCLFCLLLTGAFPGFAVVLWSDLGASLVKETGAGSDILGGAVKRDDTSADTLYFKFHVDPLSDAGTEPYFAGFHLYVGDGERLGMGNAWEAWAYSAFNTASKGESNAVFGDVDFHSARGGSISPGYSPPYELPRRGIDCTIVFKVQYLPGEPDVVTVWLNPDLAPGATEAGQSKNLVTTFRADASFDQIRLRHGGGGEGWTFSDMAIATEFTDFVNPGGTGLGMSATEAGRGSLPFTFRVWQREQGLPQNSVHALAQTRDGYLWIGNDDGVTRFDGDRFVSFGLREGLRSGRVRVLLAARDGALWIGTVGGGVSRWQSGQFTTFTLTEGLPSDSITALAEDLEHRIWIGTESGLVLWDRGHLAELPAAANFKGKTVAALGRGRKDSMWIGVAGVGVFGYASSGFARLDDPAVQSLLEDSHCLLEDRQERLWVGAGNDFVLCREGGEWRRYRIARRLARPFISALIEDAEGAVWAGSMSEGLFQFEAGKLHPVTAANGLSDNVIESLLVDSEGNLWAGTSAGLNRIRHSHVAVISQNEGLGYGAIQGLAEACPGTIWAGKPTDGLYIGGGRGFRRAGLDLVHRYPEVNTLLVARDGSCWVGGAQGVLQFKHPEADAPESEPPELRGLNVISLDETRDGTLWAGTREGELWRRGDAGWKPQTNFRSAHAITAFAQQAGGTLWIGTEGGGLYRFHEEVEQRFGKHNGLLSDLIRTLYLDAQGSLWIGTAGGGLSRYQEGKLTSFTTREGLPDNTISQILEDDSGRLWLGNNRGLACVKKADLDDLSAGRLAAVYPQVYGRSEGMASEECTGGFCPAGLKTRTGQLWFSTLKGVVIVDPKPPAIEPPPPPVALEDVTVDGSAARLSPAGTDGAAESTAELRIGPGPHRLEFHYTGLSFTAPERVRFRYRFEPLDAEWVEAGVRRIAYYPYVPPGHYRFHVSACNAAGIWNQTDAGLAVVVVPYLWQTWWFRGVAALLLLGSVAGAARLLEKRRLQRHMLHLEQERSLERERARIAQDLHDELGASLTRISLLSDLVKADRDAPAQVETHASKISLSAAQTVRALEEIVWALRPGSDSIQSLVEYIAHFASELFDGDRARCRLDLPHDLPVRSLPPEMRHNIFLIVKEALTNALKHAGATEVRVQAKASERTLEISVQDDGRGFEPPTAPRPGKQHGLVNMQNRAAAMRAALDVHSTPDKGTTVRLVVQFPDD